MNYTLRTITPQDDLAVSRLIKTVLEEFGANQPGTAYFDESTNHLSQVFESPRAAYWVIDVDGEIVGAGGIYPTAGLDEQTCELVKLYIYPAYRGSGLGKLLIERGIAQAQQFGHQNLYLESMPELSNAVRLYEKMGFEHIGCPLGNSGHFGCSIWMVKKLV